MPIAGGGGTGTALIALKRPVIGIKTSGFGMREGKLHAGLDLAAPTGQPVYASAGGTVEEVQKSNRGYGNYVRIQHGSYGGKKLATAYAHLSRIFVQTGDRIAAGQVIGAVGSSGDSTGPHLHFEVRIDGSPQDPERYIGKTVTIEPVIDAAKGAATVGPAAILGDIAKLTNFLSDRRNWLRVAMLLGGAALFLTAVVLLMGDSVGRVTGLINDGVNKGGSAAAGATFAGGMAA